MVPAFALNIDLFSGLSYDGSERRAQIQLTFIGSVLVFPGLTTGLAYCEGSNRKVADAPLVLG